MLTVSVQLLVVLSPIASLVLKHGELLVKRSIKFDLKVEGTMSTPHYLVVAIGS